MAVDVEKSDQTHPASGSQGTLQIVVPVYNDWDSVKALAPIIDNVLHHQGLRARLLLIDDGAARFSMGDWKTQFSAIDSVRILTLKRNLGHQRAICVALAWLSQQSDAETILVMDGDGEDDPADIPRLIAELNDDPQAQIVFAERTKRSEGLIFRFCYSAYRMLHLLLVGQRVRVGNFSAMNRRCLESLCTCSESWNHFAAAAFASRQQMTFVPTERATRLAGRSRMNFTSLVMHGLSALSVFSDRISTRLLLGSGIAASVTILAMAAVTVIRFATGLAIPGWASNVFGFLLILLMQIGTFMFLFSFLVLSSRGVGTFLPIRDYHFFVAGVDEVNCD
ncbi:MAG: glycosyltransferase family 2 protein [Fuerstiella sp.]